METPMRRIIAVASIPLCCASCAVPQPTPVISQVSTSVAPDHPNCIVYSTEASTGQTERQILGRACRQPDGSWKVTEGAPGQPPQAMLYSPPPDAYWGVYDPWLWGPPIGFSVGALVFVDRDHHVHAVRDFDDFEHHLHHKSHHFEQGMGVHHG
jgi:hypothetical protein